MTARIPCNTLVLILLAACTFATSGCVGFMEPRQPFPSPVFPGTPGADPPRELDKVTQPPYIIEPPDILLISAVKVVPKPPYKLDIFDIVLVRADGVPVEQPIMEAYSVQPDGTIDLGPFYGRVKVVGLTIAETADAVEEHLRRVIGPADVSVALAASAGAQQIDGQHLVGQDGSVNLGTYGSVFIAGLTIDEAREKIEAKLSETLENPEVIVQVFAYNSKVYYVLTEGAGFGDNLVTLPITGNETVMDAVSRIGGLSRVSSKKIWIARPAPNGVDCAQILPVDWDAISREGVTATNYQIFPGDRLVIAEDPFARLDSAISKITQPVERLLGFTSLGTATANRIRRFGLGINN